MPKFDSLEQPKREEAEELSKKLHENFPELKPQLTFSFPLNKNRENALEMLKSGKIEFFAVSELLNSDDFVEREAGIYFLSNLRFPDEYVNENFDKLLPLAEKLIADVDPSVRWTGIDFLGNLGEKALPILEKLAHQEKSLVVLENLSFAISQIKHRDYFEEAEQRKKAKEKSSSAMSYLLASKKPLFATLFPKELAKKLAKIQEIEKELKQEFGSKFIGIVALGSLEKGYSEPESDLDYGIIAENSEARSAFRKLADKRGLKPCCESYVASIQSSEIRNNYYVGGEKDILFRGLFFGNRKKLIELQLKALQEINNEEWDLFRHTIMRQETRLRKAEERLKLPEKELEKVKQAAALLRVPSLREETLKIVQERANKQ